MEEIYKLYEGCIYISNLGNMKSLKGEKRIATKNSEGYYIFNVGQKLRNHRLHRAVATLFLKNPDSEHFTDVNHIDGDKSNNRADNLEWCDRSYNLKHAYNLGLHKKKVEEESWAAKLTLEQAQYIYDHYETDGIHSNTNELCEQFGIAGSTVRTIITGKAGDGRPQWTSVVRNRTFPEIKSDGQPKQVAKIDIHTGEIIEVYPSIAEASRVNKGDVGACVRGKSKTAGGYMWQYL